MIRRLIAWAALASLALGPAADAQFRSRAAPGRSVGLRVLAAGVVLGPELVVNGDFASASGWGLSLATISGGVLTLRGGNADASSEAFRNTTVSVTNGGSYRVSIAYSNVSATGVAINTPDGQRTLPAGTGTYATTVAASTSDFNPYVSDLATGISGTFDNYSIRKVN